MVYLPKSAVKETEMLLYLLTGECLNFAEILFLGDFHSFFPNVFIMHVLKKASLYPELPSALLLHETLTYEL